ncbi:S26 family signal peptidase [Nocardia sp. NPDC059180]|uniref:S26 family signal peptidase n=1 Tax=Nocardia sp. NPDC059180 TaxID=3346761 RepID=UPI00368BA4E5
MSIISLFAVAALAGVAVAARRALVLVSVIGMSMEPTLRDGDRILVRRRQPADLRCGHIVVLRAPDAAQGADWECLGWHIKRVAGLPGDPMPTGVPAADGTGVVPADSVVVLGDNPFGGDSRNWGPYPMDGLVGTYVCRTWINGGAR